MPAARATINVMTRRRRPPTGTLAGRQAGTYRDISGSRTIERAEKTFSDKADSKWMKQVIEDVLYPARAFERNHPNLLARIHEYLEKFDGAERTKEHIMARTAHIVRETSESHIELSLNLDGTGKTDIDTSVPFYNHMMNALGKHSLIDLTIHAHGDTDIDVHHTVEDTAIVFGEALKQALGDKRGIRRFADATVPLDEALAKAVVDISGRPYCVCSGEPDGFEYCMIGGHFTGSLVRHVMESIAFHAGICLHMQVLAGRDPHHIAEAEFKALARALRFAVEPDPRIQGLIPSTKGAL